MIRLGGFVPEGFNLNEAQDDLAARAAQGAFRLIFAAPPCGTFSVARFFVPRDGRPGPPPLRDRDHPDGLPNLSGAEQVQLDRANAIVDAMLKLLRAGHSSGADFIIENPADRGVRYSVMFLNERHCPLWLLPRVQAFALETKAGSANFPLCAFGAPWQKFTTLLFSPGLMSELSCLSLLRCSHTRHTQYVGGYRSTDGFSSSAAAAYPTDFNSFVAHAIDAQCQVWGCGTRRFRHS